MNKQFYLFTNIYISAFTIEAATLLPPFLPLIVIKGTSNFSNSFFDSAAPTKPTGTPIINLDLLFPLS